MKRQRFESEEMEKAFWRQFQASYWLQNVVAAILGLAIYVSFGIADRIVVPDQWRTLWTIRFGIGLPLLLMAFSFLTRRSVGERYSGPLIFIAMLAGGVTVSVMNLYMPPSMENLYFYGNFLVIVFGQVFWRTHYAWPSAASLLIFLIYALITLRWGGVTMVHLGMAAAYYLSAVILLTYAGWFFLRQERSAFLLQQELHRAATVDSLTGIANRRAFFDHLAREWNRARRREETLCLLAIDLDNMKLINDGGGHGRGDQALRQVASTIVRHARRPGDLAARLGGDEFMLLLSRSDLTAACAIARQILKEVGVAGPVEGITVSIGVGCAAPQEGGASYELLIQQADQALYQAKRQGRAQAVCAPLKENQSSA